MTKSDITVSYDQKSELFGFHIPGTDKVTGVAKDEMKKIFNELFPSALQKQLGGALKDVSEDVLHEVVQRVVIPVLSDALKPIEKLMFSIGSETLKTAWHTTKGMLDNLAYEVPPDLVVQARAYAVTIPEGTENSWQWWLASVGVPGYPDSLKADLAYFMKQEQEWGGWAPFVDAFKKYSASEGYTRESLIADFNSVNFYVANAGNLSIGLYFSNLYDRADEVIAVLDRYKNTGVPATRHDIHRFIADIGPDAIDITASAKIELGISIGGSIGLWGVPSSLAIHFLDEVLEYAGVPD